MGAFVDDEHTMVTGAIAGQLGHGVWWRMIDLVRDVDGSYLNEVHLHMFSGHRFRLTIERMGDDE